MLVQHRSARPSGMRHGTQALSIRKLVLLADAKRPGASLRRSRAFLLALITGDAWKQQGWLFGLLCAGLLGARLLGCRSLCWCCSLCSGLACGRLCCGGLACRGLAGGRLCCRCLCGGLLCRSSLCCSRLLCCCLLHFWFSGCCLCGRLFCSGLLCCWSCCFLRCQSFASLVGLCRLALNSLVATIRWRLFRGRLCCAGRRL